MKEIQITVFEAFDGTHFADAIECIAHDAAMLDKLLVSLPREVVRESLKRAGMIIRADRSPGPTKAKEAEAA